MRDVRGERTLGTIAATLACLSTLGLYCTSIDARDLRIENVTIVSPERSSPMRDATVRIKGDRIVSISSGSASQDASSSSTVEEVINGKGLYLAPGLIDSHVHLADVPGMMPPHEQAHPDVARTAREQIPRSYLYFGFTTLVDLISTPAQVANWNAHDVHPDVYFCGATPVVDGYPTIFAPKPIRYRLTPYMLIQRDEEATAPEGIDPTAHTPEAVVSRMKADGASCVKAFYERGFSGQGNLPVPRLDTIRALVRAAHAAHMPVFLHANGTDAQAFALEAGVDVIAHGLWHWKDKPAKNFELSPAAKQALDGVIQAKVGFQPTMQVLYGERDLFNPGYLDDPRLARVLPANLIAWYRSSEGQWFRDELAPNVLPRATAESNDAAAQWESARSSYAAPIGRNEAATKYLAERNARFLFGTDTPSAPSYANPPGLNGWLEMHRLVEVGLTPAQIFRAATLTNAEALGLSREIGTVESGKRANLLLLGQDPTQTIQAYDEIVSVILRGEVFDRADLAANKSAKP